MQQHRTWVIFLVNLESILLKLLLLFVTIDDLHLNESASINYLY